MKNLFVCIFFYLSIFAFSNPIEQVNIYFDDKLSFEQTSLDNPKQMLETSSGKFFRKSDGSIKIDVLTPYLETYYINNSTIKIYDHDFDDIKVINLNEIQNSSLINLLLNGIEINENNIREINVNSFEIIIDDKNYYFEFIDEKNLVMKFKDNMNINNLIKFSKR